MTSDKVPAGQVVCLIGSGASAACGMPRFSNLLDELSGAAPELAAISNAHWQRVQAALARLPGIVGGSGDAEQVLVDLEKQVYERGIASRVLHDIRMGIWWLMAVRSREAEGAAHAPYGKLAEGLQAVKKRLALVVDFNWDELLEAELSQTWWFPEHGRPKGMDRVKVVKPHGSVFLIAELKSGRWIDPLKLTKQCDPSAYQWDTNEDGCRPLMVYPGIAKSSNHWYLWRSRRRLHKALGTCQTVIVVGLGLCPTDDDIVGLIEHAMWHRLGRADGQLSEAYVVDWAPGRASNRAIQRLQEALRPRSLFSSTKGFQECVKQDWPEIETKLISS